MMVYCLQEPTSLKDKALLEGACKDYLYGSYTKLQERTFYLLKEMNEAILIV